MDAQQQHAASAAAASECLGTTKADAAGSIVPLSMKFLGLRLRLAFTKRRFDEVEAIYRSHVDDAGSSSNGTTATATTTGGSTTRNAASEEEQARLAVEQLQGVFDASFWSLREEILAIEQGQEIIKKKILPKVVAQIDFHESFVVFLQGFYMDSRSSSRSRSRRNDNHNNNQKKPCASGTTDSSSSHHLGWFEEEEDKSGAYTEKESWVEEEEGDEDEASICDDDQESSSLNHLDQEDNNSIKNSKPQPPLAKCYLPMLNMGNETTTAVKQLIAQFAGVPIQGALHDLRSLASMLGRGRFASTSRATSTSTSTSTGATCPTPRATSEATTNTIVEMVDVAMTSEDYDDEEE